MTDSAALQAGVDRFAGYAGLYDEVRPAPPDELGVLLAAYVGARPGLVVDLGSGTGLSARWAARWSDRVIGVEPSDDMRAVASAAAPANASFVPGWSHDTGLASGTADVVVAVQALHWMEPTSTFAEAVRLLRPGGVFAAVDCDWPPSIGSSQAEQAWERCRKTALVFEARLAGGLCGDELRAPVDEDDPAGRSHSADDAHRDRSLAEGVRSWSKAEHLSRMIGSGRFAWCREVVVHSADHGDANRYVKLLQSQGDYQTLRRAGLDDATLGVERFRADVEDALGEGSQPWWFTYRARLGFTNTRTGKSWERGSEQ